MKIQCFKGNRFLIFKNYSEGEENKIRKNGVSNYWNSLFCRTFYVIKCIARASYVYVHMVDNITL